jgi:hypothetical protein
MLGHGGVAVAGLLLNRVIKKEVVVQEMRASSNPLIQKIIAAWANPEDPFGRTPIWRSIPDSFGQFTLVGELRQLDPQMPTEYHPAAVKDTKEMTLGKALTDIVAGDCVCIGYLGSVRACPGVTSQERISVGAIIVGSKDQDQGEALSRFIARIKEAGNGNRPRD